MDLTIVARKCQAGERFREHAEKKLGRLERLLGDDAEAAKIRLTATAEHDEMEVELYVTLGSVRLRAEEHARQIEDAFDKALDRLVRELRRHKTRVEKKIRPARTADFMAYDADEEEVTEEEDFPIVRTKEIELRPETPEEAILQMNLLGHNFYMFLDAEDAATKVVYRRKDGGYGLLEPVA
ncbi:MAG: ribosome-associated translation inhibitor RaiA [Oscillospiraceae bacterium]|jgi:putative sigma-54 modulation protein|nr:ribosome-associated translation inhibitor RaiA [Oscillospiraceae bacterium]